MKFFVGHHHPSKARYLDRAFISANALWHRKSGFQVNDWIMDSGAFSEIALHGGYRPERSVSEYARRVWRFGQCGNMLKAVSQDFMVEPFMLDKTGGTVESHQRLTIERYRELYALCGPIIMPCLQGQEPSDYVTHVCMYGADLLPGEWVGVGSVCKRKDESSIREVLRAILEVRPDLRLHGFGLKITALRCAWVWDRLYSADSMSWSFDARYTGGNPNGWREAVAFGERINNMPRQEVLL